MTQKLTTAADPPVRVVIVTLDQHLAGAMARAMTTLSSELPGLEISLHAVGAFEQDPAARDRCLAAIAEGDIIVVSMLFMESHIESVLPALKARQPLCDAMVCCLSAGEVMRLTRMGQFRMDGADRGVMALLKRLRGASKSGSNSGAGQVAMLRRIPKILRFIPGTAQDVRAYFLTLQYWLAGSDANTCNLVRFLIDRYAGGPRRKWRGKLKPAAPVEYPDTGLYHPRLPDRIARTLAELPPAPARCRGTVGLLVMRSYVLAGNARHYDGVIEALEARGLRVVPAFASGLDARPAIDSFFTDANGRSTIDALVSLTGFSLVGGPAYNDSAAAGAVLQRLDVPYLAAHSVEFQTLEAWEASDRGLMPVEATMMVAIPELDGSSGPIVFGGRAGQSGPARDMVPHRERIGTLADRVAALIDLRRKARAERRIGVVIFGFPPNAGSTGTAAFLSVYRSLYNTLCRLKAEGYAVELPASADELRERILVGNASRFGTTANVHTRVKVDDHVRGEPHLREIEAQWGPAPGRHQCDGSSIFVLGAQFGNVFVGVQPAFGYEGDPMRLLFEKGFAPTHAFAAFYRWLRSDFRADAVLHFGTHGALEFMPGKQTGLGAGCWPDRLIGSLPNFYFYAANNPSEGTIAKRRSAAVTLSYLTPPIAHAGLYRGLAELKASLERWRLLPPDEIAERESLAELITAQATAVDIEVPANATGHGRFDALAEKILELEYTLIPSGLHVIGEVASQEERVDLIATMEIATRVPPLARDRIAAIVAGSPLPPTRDKDEAERLVEVARIAALLAADHELPALVHALDGKFVAPAPSGDLIRTPAILPTGRNLHGFDPFRMPSAFAVHDGRRQADRLLARAAADGQPLPRTVAMVLWGTDNLKSEGGPIAQALALMGARPRFDTYGRLCGAALVPLAELGRPRIDVMMTLSGIFRDLLPLQTRMLAEAAFLAAAADEPVEQNFVRKHALAYQAANGCDLEAAALRVFSNADNAYGSNVNHLIENGRWDAEDELAEVYTRRKSFAYYRNGAAVQQTALLQSILSGVEITYQNLESVELGVTTVDHYFDTLGGITRAVKRASGGDVPVYIGDQTRGEGRVRSLSEQVAIETRTRMLNPRWYEALLAHGHEGVRQIEAHVTNTMGWSATTGQVSPWIYQRLTETYVLDADMRARLAALNPTASAKMANRLIEAHERNYWKPDPETLDALRRAGQELEDRMEGVGVEAAA